MTRASIPTTARPPTSSTTPLLFTFTLALLLLVTPEVAQTRSTTLSKTISAGNSAKKKGVSKVTYQRSSSEETRSERDRRMYRECKGLHNAGACRGYTRQ